MRRSILILMLCCVAALAAAPDDGRAERGKVEKLRHAALGDDLVAATVAVAQLNQLANASDPAQRPMAGMTGTLLARSEQCLRKYSLSASEVKKLARIDEELAKVRKAADENLAKLEKGDPVKLAHEHYDRLMKLTAAANDLYITQARLIDAIRFRATVLDVLRHHLTVEELAAAEQADAKAKESIERTLGMKVEEAAKFPDFESGPLSGVRRGLWLYRAARRIESYNESIARSVDPEEGSNAQLVNVYREALGRMPLELDLRLTQAARKHSKEMADLNYFAHDSPVAANKSPWDRIGAAGYSGGSAENIAGGTGKGDSAFWMWFDSPGHHKNMVGDHQAIGVGRWQGLMTQNFGRGTRLMPRPGEPAPKAEIKGDVLPPFSAKKRR